MSSNTWDASYGLSPALPNPEHLDELRDLASEVVAKSGALEASLAPATAHAIGARLRLINSHYSNAIEGIVASYRGIEGGLRREFAPITAERYGQEIGAAHVEVEKELVRAVLENPGENISSPEFISRIHRSFFSKLPPEHQFTHEGRGITTIPVLPGEFRDGPIGIQGQLLGHDVHMGIGPATREDLDANMALFGRLYAPDNFRGAEAKVIAVAASHLKLGWLHPFRDGNGRTIRLHSTLFMARNGVNRKNLWSLSRGLGTHRSEYMNSLFIGNPQPDKTDRERVRFCSENIALFCEDFLMICREQIGFMRDQLQSHTVSDRIDRFAAEHLQYKRDAARLIRAVFDEGSLQRAKLPEVFPGMDEKTCRTIADSLVRDGLLEVDGELSPFTLGLPAKAMAAYFSDLCTPSVMGAPAGFS